MAETSAAAASLIEETSDSSECCSAPGPKAVVAPWLMRKNHSREEGSYFYNICGPNHETCRGFMPELFGTTCYQKPSHQGWVIVVCNKDPEIYAADGSTVETPRGCSYGDCFLWNPTTNEIIMLPAILEFLKPGYGSLDWVLSSPPRTTAHINPYGDNASDSMVLFKFYHEDQYTFVFCRPRETQWRIHEVSQDINDLLLQSWVGTVHCFKGKLYVMCEGHNPQDPLDHHLEIEYFTKDTDLTISIKSFQVKKEASLFPLVGGKAVTDSYYVESHDELFRVDIINWRGTYDAISIEVVRLNFVLMEWEKVNSLGDHVLFINSQYHSTTCCCSAAELGLPSGCLYYLQHYDRCLHRFQIESTSSTSILPDLWPTGRVPYLDWLIMPINVQQGRVKNVLGSKDEGILMDQETKTSTSTVVSDENQGEECNAEVVEVASYWDNLHEDIVRFIANLLHGSDYKHFRSVSKANRSILPKVQATLFLSPWLVFSRDHNFTTFSVVNPMYNNENYFMNLTELAGSTIRFQKGGWLLMTRTHNIFFYNSFTREMVNLPDIDRHGFSVVSFSSSPTSSDCIVFVMDERDDDQVYIDFIRRGEAHWSSLIFDRDRYIRFRDIAIFHGGAFFCLDNKGTFGVFSLKDNSWKVFEKPYEEDCDFFQSFFIECGRGLLVVNISDDDEPVGIFILNFSEMEWVEVKSLGEHTLFVSDTSCVYAVAPNSSMKNKIYFPRLYTKDGGIVFYSLETRSYHTLGSRYSATNLDNTEEWFRNCTWIEPNRSISSAEELDWHKTPFPNRRRNQSF